jgi:hypothetical protein
MSEYNMGSLQSNDNKILFVDSIHLVKVSITTKICLKSTLVFNMNQMMSIPHMVKGYDKYA